VPGGAHSISRFQQPSSLSYAFRTPGNLNSSVFGHPTQNSSSKVFQELFGTDNFKKNWTEHIVINSPSPTTPVMQSNGNPPGGVPGPGDSDGDNSSNKGGSRPPRNPQAPCLPRWNPFKRSSGEAAATVTTKTMTEPQFDTKLKMDAIPTWDGNPESLRRWFLKLNSLSKRLEVIFRQLGVLVPTRLIGSAET